MCGLRKKRIISSMNDGARVEGLILFQFGFCSGFRNDEKLDANEVCGDSGWRMFYSWFCEVFERFDEEKWILGGFLEEAGEVWTLDGLYGVA